MDLDGFWALIDESRAFAAGDPPRSQRLIKLLERLPAQDIVDFEALKDQMIRRADTVDMLAAHNVITGGCGGGDFYFYFLHWLVSLGRQTFERVTADPDALVHVGELPEPLGDYRTWPDERWPDWEGLISVAAEAYAAVTGNEFGGEVDVRDMTGSLFDSDTSGESWDMDDPGELAKRLPRLYQAALPTLRRGWPRQPPAGTDPSFTAPADR